MTCKALPNQPMKLTVAFGARSLSATRYADTPGATGPIRAHLAVRPDLHHTSTPARVAAHRTGLGGS